MMSPTDQGLMTKRRSGSGGHMRSGGPLGRGCYLYNLLGKPLYFGRITNKEKSFEGRHLPIIDLKTWADVQARRAANTLGRALGSRASAPSSLQGKFFDEAGLPAAQEIHQRRPSDTDEM